jgi:predicted RND superfamily exporter protein
VESIASVLPESQEEKIATIRTLAPTLRTLEVEPEDALFSLPSLKRTVKKIQFKLQGRTAKEGIDDPVLEANLLAKKFLKTLDTVEPEVARERLVAFSGILFEDYRGKIADLKKNAEPAPIRTQDLPTVLKDRFIGKTGKYLVSIFPAGDIWDFDAREELLKQMRAVDPKVTGNLVHLIESSRLMKEGYIHGGGYAMAAILLYIFITFKNLRTVALILMPVVVGSIWTVGIMDLFGIRFNLANLVILPLILGVGVVNGIHIIHRYREEPDKTTSVLERSTGQAVVLSSLTTMMGFGSLMVADHQGIYSLGLVLTLGVFSCLLVSVTTLPAVLRFCTLKGWKV